MSFLDKISWPLILLVMAFLALAPFTPEPHLWEKLKMLAAGSLVKPVDIFDLFWHSWPVLIVVLKLFRQKKQPVTPVD